MYMYTHIRTFEVLTPPWWNGTYVVRGRLSICSGVCGDPYQEVSPLTNIAAITNYPIQATYTSGQTVTFTIKMQVNHGGRMTFRLCDRRTDLNQACFNARTLLRSVYLHGELVIRPMTMHINGWEHGE